MRKLNDEEIEILIVYVRQRHVKYYDLQCELVDHLANDIENLWTIYPEISYELAREAAYKKFGPNGFKQILESRKKALNKKYRILIFKELLKFFTLPKILITLLLLYLVYISFSIPKYQQIFSLALGFSFIGYTVFCLVKFNRGIKKQYELTKKRWLAHNIVVEFYSGIGLIILPQFLILDIPFRSNSGAIFSQTKLIVLTVLITLGVLYMYISTIVIPKRINNNLKQNFTEYQEA